MPRPRKTARSNKHKKGPKRAQTGMLKRGRGSKTGSKTSPAGRLGVVRRSWLRACVRRACLACRCSLTPPAPYHTQDISAIAQDNLKKYGLVVPGLLLTGAIDVSFTDPLLSKYLYNFVRDPALGLAPDDAVRRAYVLKHCSEIKHAISSWGSQVSAS